MIELSHEHLQGIRRHAEQDYPHECCGLLLGRFSGTGRKTVVEVYAISNAREEEAKRNRFLITPQELLRGELHARRNKLEVIGFYHSHPDHLAAPSGYDLDHALPVYSYVIVSVRAGQAGDLLSWELEPDRSKFNAEDIAAITAAEIGA